MRLNKYIAHSSGLSRRQADELIRNGEVYVDGEEATLGETVEPEQKISVQGKTLHPPATHTTILLNKPTGYVCSRKKQGDVPTIYSLLPEPMHALKPIGRLDKMSRGLLLLTSDGDLAQSLTHPKKKKSKVYFVKLHKELTQKDIDTINAGIKLQDGVSNLSVDPAGNKRYKVTMSEGRNRQIRRNFAHINYEILDLKRTKFGEYELGELGEGKWIKL